MTILFDKTGLNGWVIPPGKYSQSGPAYTGFPSSQITNNGDIGLKISSCTKGLARDMEISNILGACIDLSTSVAWDDRILVSGFDVHDSYFGINTHDGGEYAIFSDGFIHDCIFGAQIGSGNITLADTVITKNDIGLYYCAGSNDAHGVCNGVQSNHNNQNLVVHGITNGQTFNGCNFFGHILGGSNLGNIEIQGSTGVVFNGGQIGSTTMSIDATSRVCMRGVVLQGIVSLTVAIGAYLDAKNAIVMPGSVLTINGSTWSGNT